MRSFEDFLQGFGLCRFHLFKLIPSDRNQHITGISWRC
jgi:hypothetical protein